MGQTVPIIIGSVLLGVGVILGLVGAVYLLCLVQGPGLAASHPSGPPSGCFSRRAWELHMK
jgi:hypothetical protein